MNDFPPCAQRQRLISFHKDGTKEPIQRCVEKQADAYQTTVTPAICSECPVRVGVTKQAIKASEYRPPLADRLYDVPAKKRDVDSPNPWKPCQHRSVANVASCCTGLKQVRICESLDCHLLGSVLDPKQCTECVFREP